MRRSRSRLAITSCPEIAPLLQPAATSPRISHLLRGDSRTKRKSSGWRLADSSRVHDPGVDERRPSATARTARRGSPRRKTRSLSRSTPRSALLDRRPGGRRLAVPAEEHDADLRVGRPQLGRQPDHLIGLGERHPDVRHDHVWLRLADPSEASRRGCPVVTSSMSSSSSTAGGSPRERRCCSLPTRAKRHGSTADARSSSDAASEASEATPRIVARTLVPRHNADHPGRVGLRLVGVGREP